jgi:hypothetical protein
MLFRTISKTLSGLACVGALAISNVSLAEAPAAKATAPHAGPEAPGILAGSCFIYIGGELVQGVTTENLQGCINYATFVSQQYGVAVQYHYCDASAPCWLGDIPV